MPPRLPLRPLTGRAGSVVSQASSNSPRVCLLCSLASPATSSRASRTSGTSSSKTQRRMHSTAPTAPPRTEIIDSLLELQKIAPNYVNLSRLQLALQGLRQAPGEESIRVAILGLANGAESGQTAKELLRALLADSLSTEQDWECQLAQHDPRQPLIVRIRQKRQDEDVGTLQISKTNLLHELEISSPGLNDLHLEILLTEVSPFTGGSLNENAAVHEEETFLVPTVDIPSNTGRFNPITTPVHKALIVTDGIMGASAVASLPVLENKDTVLAAVNLPGYSAKDPSLTFEPVDVAVAQKGVDLFREDLSRAVDAQKLYNQSHLPAVLNWLKTGVKTTDATTKPALRQLIASLLQNTTAAVEREEAAQLGGILSSEMNATQSSASASLNHGLAHWSQSAHEELQTQLDRAFAGQPWRRLGWWKLFWRVDDVGFLTNKILAQNFLPSSERELVYLAGRIQESGLLASAGAAPRYSQPSHEVESGHTKPAAAVATDAETASSKWPTHIAFTRRYLHRETIPALQALAQKLVLQASSSSGFAASISALLYVSSTVSTVYEAGAVAALGIVWSLRRMQKKWESAREYWEGDVREEGRKALRGTEASVREVLEGKAAKVEEDAELVEQREKVRGLVEKATEALNRMK